MDELPKIPTIILSYPHIAGIKVMSGLTPGNYPIMVIPCPQDYCPPTEVITRFFLDAFQHPTWKEKVKIPFAEIKFPHIGESWTCAIIYCDREGKVCTPKENEEEAKLFSGDLRMHERLMNEGYETVWHISSPHMPISEFRMWQDLKLILP